MKCYKEECKNCSYSYEQLLNWNLFPWLEGKTYQLMCKLDKCIYNEVNDD
jgi:hypothetical protein